MTPRIPRGPRPPGERLKDTQESRSESRTPTLALAELKPIEKLDALRRFSGGTALEPRLSRSLLMFQGLPEARLIVRDPNKSFKPFSVLRRWYQEWRGQALAATPVKEINRLLGAGTDSRVRIDGDVTTLHFPADKGVIQIGLEGSSGLTFLHDSNSWLGNQFMFREGNQVFLQCREGGESSATWLWNRVTGAWLRVPPGQPLLLKKDMVLAFGPTPSLHEIFHIPQRAQEMKAVLVRVEGSPEVDSIQMRRIQGKSLHFFLSGIVRESNLVLGKSSPSLPDWILETLGFQNLYVLGRVALRLETAKYQEDIGYPREALLTLEIAEFELRQKLIDIGCHGRVEISRKYSEILPKDVRLQLEMVELYEHRAGILERLQEPEAAAEAYSSAVEHMRNILLSAVDPVTQSMREWGKTSRLDSIRDDLQWGSYRAHRLFYQKAERHHDEGNLGAAALAYETAAKFVTEAAILQNSSSYYRNYANHPVISEEVLLKKALEDYRQAGMMQDVERIRAELFSP